MKKYNPKAIEAKWQKQWLQKKTFVTADAQKGRKKNVLFEFAYPSGVGLHMGHARPFVASDIVSRYYRSRGFSVLYATGWDAFGLPAENFAIKNGIHPSITTAKNIANAKKQMLSWGLGLDWSREINTTDPNYYKWTQWLFLQFFKEGLAYEATGPINWCPKDKCGLANEEVVAGACERCGTLVEKREMKQWFLRITAYAEKLLDGLKHLPEWPDMVKVQQENWIGKSIGAEIDFSLVSNSVISAHPPVIPTEVGIHGKLEKLKISETRTKGMDPSLPAVAQGSSLVETGMTGRRASGMTNQEKIKVFTTRPDTIFGATYLVVAPEHEMIQNKESRLPQPELGDGGQVRIENKEEVYKYIEQAKKKSELTRLDATKEKTGVELKGVRAINPATGEEIPVWVSDYVLGNYGTGAIMAVPAHDDRDFAFAKKFGLPIKSVIAKDFGEELPNAKSVTGPVVIGYDPKTKLFMSLLNKGQRWLVGGGLEDGETYEQAAKRELKEEAGFSDVQAMIQLGDPTYSYYYNSNKNSNRRSFSPMFLAVIDSKEKIKQKLEAHENYQVVWSDLSAIVEDFKKEPSGRGHWIECLSRTEKAIKCYEKGIPYDTDLYIGNGLLFDSGKFSGMKSEEAIPKMAAEFGRPTTQYKLRDWLFSRQRYWGEPIPIVHCAVCAAQAVSGKQVSRKAESKDQLTALPAYSSTAYPKAEFYFPGDAYFADIARGYKTVETRSFDPSGENKAWAEIEVGDVVSIYNKKSKKKFLAEVEEIRLFKNFLELYKAKDWLEKTFPGKKFKNPIEVELAYKKIYKGYPEQVRRFGLAAWKIKIQTVPVAVKEKDLPLKLPQVKKYEPTGTGESPLAQVESWVNTVCPECKAPARRETNTMPQWAGSSWYWLRYTDPKNKTAFAAKDKLKFWTPVDIYFGGMEHTVLHLLYSRFWNLFMYDQKLVPTKEPYTKRVPHGIILGPDGDKMSKSKGNVVNPDEIVKKYGADTLRMYEMFLGPHEAQVAWNDQGVVGVRRFLDRVWTWVHEVESGRLQVPSVAHDRLDRENRFAKNSQLKTTNSDEVERLLHKLIKKIGEDIENFRFNTCVSSFMEFLNSVKDLPVTVDQARKFLITLYPFAPHIVEELNQVLGGKKSVQMEEWPKFNPRLALDKSVTLVVQVNGKVREKIVVPLGSLESAVKEQVLKLDKVKNLIAGAEIKRIIFVQDRLINFLV